MQRAQPWDGFSFPRVALQIHDRSWSCENAKDSDPDTTTGEGEGSTANTNISENDERCDQCKTRDEGSTMCDRDCEKRYDLEVLRSAAPFLIDVQLGGCDLSDDFATIVKELTQLRRLEVIGCNIGALPDLSPLKNLNHVKLCQNEIADVAGVVPHDADEGWESAVLPSTLLSSRFQGFQLCKMGAITCTTHKDCPAPATEGECSVSPETYKTEKACSDAGGTWTRGDTVHSCDVATGHCLRGGSTRSCSFECPSDNGCQPVIILQRTFCVD